MNCGCKLKEGVAFCSKCGTKVMKLDVNNNPKIRNNQDSMDPSRSNGSINHKKSYKSPIMLMGGGLLVVFIFLMVMGSALGSVTSSDGQNTAIVNSSQSQNSQNNILEQTDDSNSGSENSNTGADTMEWLGDQDMNNQGYIDQISDEEAKSHEYSPTPDTDKDTAGDDSFDDGG